MLLSHAMTPIYCCCIKIVVFNIVRIAAVAAAAIDCLTWSLAASNTAAKAPPPLTNGNALACC